MKLEFERGNEITLPSGLAESGLSLAEIGAVTCLACLQGGAAADAEIFLTHEMEAALKGLKERKIIKAEVKDGAFKIQVDLSEVGL